MRHQSWHFGFLALRNTWCGKACLGARVSSKFGTWHSEQVILQFMCVGSLAGVTYLRYTVLTSPKKSKTAVHCCDPSLLVLVMLVSRNVFHVVSALQSIVFRTTFANFFNQWDSGMLYVTEFFDWVDTIKFPAFQIYSEKGPKFEGMFRSQH